MLTYASIAEFIEAGNERGISISRLVLEDQASVLEKSQEEVIEEMSGMLDIMRRSAEAGRKPDVRSTSGLTGGDGHLMSQYAINAKTLSGTFCSRAIATALAIAEYNASMGKIVAAPTAGACGILPAGILTMMEEARSTKEQAIMALITAGAIGIVIAKNASISGAQGGCQAECGSAAAMTAAALVEMAGGTNEMASHAAAIALMNQLGLVCDPVAGLVEVPCINRNAGGIMVAIGAADMALSGIKSLIPADEVIMAMGAIGHSMPSSLRETSEGGLAATPTGEAIMEKLFGKSSSQSTCRGKCNTCSL